ncbi:hypothetical protein KFK09_003039 [Dendrobium nobile]|uniref:Germin-like protein n=1 Tax=Dendrobium nobile TaxID=94219 RepID=A0A8T3C5D8_DENNO|nr:hypothetical protein KFK09_003039 [Dendrobium nobile]
MKIRSHRSLAPSLLLLLILPFLLFLPTTTYDPSPNQDFCIAIPNSSIAVNGFPCKPSSSVTSDDFFFPNLSVKLNTSSPFNASATLIDVLSFPALNTLGISVASVVFGRGGLITAHSHPRATEIVFVTGGQVLIGFVATDGKFFSKVVGAGGLFVIPMGLVHFEYNVGQGIATATVAFNSQLPGIVIPAAALFGSTPAVPDAVLREAFGVGEEVVQEIRAKFG